MKSGIKIVLALFVAIILFLLIGVVSPWQKAETHIEIFASPEHCWNVYHDHALFDKWVDNFKAIEQLSNDKMGKGSSFKMSMVDKNGALYETTQKIVLLKKPDWFEIEYNNNLQRGKVHVELIESDLGTILKSTNSYTNDNLFYRSLFHFFNDKVTDASKAQLNKLKIIIEETPESRYAEG